MLSAHNSWPKIIPLLIDISILNDYTHPSTENLYFLKHESKYTAHPHKNIKQHNCFQHW